MRVLVAVEHLHRLAAELVDALGPQPGVMGLLGQMQRQLHLRVGIVHELDEPQEQGGAMQLGVAVVAHHLDHAGICSHAVALHSAN